jgi:hypothetical protein
MEAGENEGGTEVDLRAIRPLGFWFGLGAVPRFHLGLTNCTLFRLRPRGYGGQVRVLGEMSTA